MKRNLCSVLCALCLALALPAYDLWAGQESYKKPIPIESRVYEYGTGTNIDEYIQHVSKDDYNVSRMQSIDVKPAPKAPEPVQTPEEKPPPPPPAPEPEPKPEPKPAPPPAPEPIPVPVVSAPVLVQEPDDVLLVPARVAKEEPKPEMVAPTVGVIIVEKGDTVYSLSKKHNVPLRDLLEENKISAPYAIGVGQKLRLPAARMHTVVAGDTLYSISRAYSVDINSLANENNLSAPYALAVGQKLRLPASVKVQGSAPAAQHQQTAAAEKELEKLNAEKKRLEEEKKKVEVEKQRIEKEKATAATQKQKEEAEKKKIEAEKKKVELEKKEKAAAAKIAEQKKKISSAPVAPLPKMDAVKPMRFTWPVRGRILSDFGYKNNGLYNDGINIGAPAGTVVKASESGVVAYAGNELKGMGNLVIIQHNGGWMTVYAHLDIMNVQRGYKVAGGEKIGTIGKTGKVAEPQLHFEIRKGTKAYNPQKELK
ncbi:MAG: LysM peptidoglycan-binding domain-containing M23 family metallopeptidase [Alphaproteobacteria bacterium]|nr:LysM peptidoglycan-binding domain-containing M23 family metallopeptidase [Alphaproteobacteria bacterium]